MGGEASEGPDCIINTQEKFFVGVGQVNSAIDYGTDGAFFNGLGDEGMAVEIRAGYGEKAIAASDRARIRRDGIHSAILLRRLGV